MESKLTDKFGGTLLVGKRKDKRPLADNRPIHLVLKATNSFVLLRVRKRAERLIANYSRKMDVTIYRQAVNADHIHLAIRVPNRTQYVRWIRAVTSVLSQKFLIKWKLRPFTRIAEWGSGFTRLKRYVIKNERQADAILEAHVRVDQFRESWWGKILYDNGQRWPIRPKD